MSWLEWTLMYAFYLALLAVIVGGAVALARAGRRKPAQGGRR